MEPQIDIFAVEVVEDGDGAAVVRVTGELDVATAPRLGEEFISLVDRGVCLVTLDMAALGFIDSTGLGVVVTAMKRLRGIGGDLVLRSPTRAARKVLEITGLSEVFAIT